MQTSPGVWEVYRVLAEDYVNGYGYAIATGSTVIMEMFQARCVAEADGRGGSSGDCDFRVDYATPTPHTLGQV